MNDLQHIHDPLIVIYRPEEGGEAITLIMKSDLSHRHFGLLVADLIRHIAAAYQVREEDVVEWVNREMNHPTTKIEGGTVQ